MIYDYVDIHVPADKVNDNRLVWYGSINLLSYGGSEESIMRLDSRELATELDLIFSPSDIEDSN